MPVQFSVSMVKGKVPAYPMAGKIWEGVEADAEDDDEEQFLPAIVYLWEMAQQQLTLSSATRLLPMLQKMSP